MNAFRAVGGVAALCLVSLTASACSDEGADSSTANSPIAAALSRISDDALGDQVYVEAANQAEIVKLSKGGKPAWGEQLLTLGLRELGPYAPALGLTPKAATYAISVGMAPATITVVHGGQDADKVRAGAKELGFGGDGDALKAKDVQAKVIADQLSLKNDDVVAAGAEADLGWADAKQGSVGSDKKIQPLVACMGDVVALAIATVDGGQLVAIGLRDASGTATAVICTAGGKKRADEMQADAASGESLTGQEYSTYFTDAKAAVADGDLAQLTAALADDVPGTLPFQMLIKHDLPGI